MQPTELIQRVRMYLNERDTIEGQALYSVVLDRLRQAGATGATVLRGVAGFGPSHRLRVERGEAGRTAPIIVEWIDRAERVARLLPTLDDLLPNAMITVEDVRVHRATLRASGPFGERLIGAVTEREVVVAHADTSPAEALRWLIERPQSLLPMLDTNERLTGTVAADVLAARAGLPLRLLAALTPDERAELLDRLATDSLTALAAAEPRTLAADAPIPQAVNTLVEWGIDALPVIERDGRFVGLFGIEQVLRAALDGRNRADGAVRDAEPPLPVRLLMQGAVPMIAASAPAADALARLLATPDHFLVVVDERRTLGLLDDTHLLRQLTGAARARWLAALRAGSAAVLLAEAAVLPTSAGDLPLAPAPTIGPLTSRDDATRALLDGGLERLVVVEESGQVVGIIARRGLLRALAQELTS